jgi:glycerophosphoryl diester phosphodiesterase
MSLNKLKIIPPVIAHRGASAYAPENTLAAFEKARELGAKWIEFDVQLTTDNQVVVFHDEELSRTTNGRGKVIDHPLAYLKSLDTGSWFDPSFRNEKILTLVEVVAWLQEKNLSANIEIKAPLGLENRWVEAVIACLEKDSIITSIPLIISSFNLFALQAVRRFNPSIPISLLLDEWSDDWKPFCEELNCISVNLSDGLVTKDRLAAIADTQRSVMVYTVNDIKRAKALFDWGVAAVFSDCPDRILGG